MDPDEGRSYTAVRTLFGEDDIVEVRMGERWYRIPLEDAIELRWKLADTVRQLGVSAVQ